MIRGTDIDVLMEHLRTHLNWGDLHEEDRIRFLALALCGETGELANLIKKDWRGDDGDRSEKIRSELADIGNYVFMLAVALGIDLHAEMYKKLIEVEQRPAWKGGRR